MTTICLVRHGETDWNAAGRIQGREDTPLNSAGREQARCAGRYLQSWQWDILVASPLSRASDTARIIGEAVGLPLETRFDGLMERDYAVASGMTPAEIAQVYPDGAIPGLETRPTVQARMMAVLNQLTVDYSAKRIIAVSHGGAINTVLAHLSNGEIGTGKTQLGNACITLLQHTHGAWEIEYYNYLGHLPADPIHPVSKHVGLSDSTPGQTP